MSPFWNIGECGPMSAFFDSSVKRTYVSHFESTVSRTQVYIFRLSCKLDIVSLLESSESEPMSTFFDFSVNWTHVSILESSVNRTLSSTLVKIELMSPF